MSAYPSGEKITLSIQNKYVRFIAIINTEYTFLSICPAITILGNFFNILALKRPISKVLILNISKVF